MRKRQPVLSLRPTQFAVGMLEVEEKIAILGKLKKRDLRRYLNDNPIPVVLSPERELYLVDHHHLLTVCYHIGVRKVPVRLVRDLSRSRMSYTQFWKWMAKHGDLYLFCQFGEGPRKELYLPRDIRGLANDPYRSIAWFVRKAGGFQNSDRNYSEFTWANFFRAHKLLDRSGPRGLSQALVKAVALAQSSSARHLPGYGKLNLEAQDRAVKTLKKTIRALERPPSTHSRSQKSR